MPAAILLENIAFLETEIRHLVKTVPTAAKIYHKLLLFGVIRCLDPVLMNLNINQTC